MAKKEFTYRGKTAEDLKAMPLETFIALLPARERRKFKRGFTEQEKIFLKDVQAGGANIKTHCRDMIVLPNMIDKLIKVHSGKEFSDVRVTAPMVGHRLGEFALTRKRVKHGAAGVQTEMKT